MADKIGVLGSTTNVTTGTHTAYTVPAGKAAKVRLFLRGLATASGPTIAIAINGITVMTKAVTASNHFWTTKLLMYNESATAPAGTSDAVTVAPAPYDFFLSEGDVVTITISTNDLSSLNMQVVGSEVDVT